MGGAPLDPEYEWHPAARAFQTPGMGERVMESMTPEALQQALAAAGVPAADAAEAAAARRSHHEALHPRALPLGGARGPEWTDDLRRVTAPGLVLWGERDPYAAPRFGARLAERTGARFVSFPAARTGGSSSGPTTWPTSSGVSGSIPAVAPGTHSRSDSHTGKEARDG